MEYLRNIQHFLSARATESCHDRSDEIRDEYGNLDIYLTHKMDYPATKLTPIFAEKPCAERENVFVLRYNPEPLPCNKP